jgi:WD40 repeat protein
MTVAFSPDGTTVAGGAPGGDIKLWNVTTGALRADLATSGDQITALAFAPDGRALAVGVDRAVQLWDVAAGRLVARLEGHQSQVKCLAYAPDGMRLASGSSDKTVRLWCMAQYQTRNPIPRQ